MSFSYPPRTRIVCTHVQPCLATSGSFQAPCATFGPSSGGRISPTALQRYSYGRLNSTSEDARKTQLQPRRLLHADCSGRASSELFEDEKSTAAEAVEASMHQREHHIRTRLAAKKTVEVGSSPPIIVYTARRFNNTSAKDHSKFLLRGLARSALQVITVDL